MVNSTLIFEQWQAGELSDQEALEQLCTSLNSLEDRLEPIEATHQMVRSQISEVVERQGGNVELAGFGKLVITSPTITTSYDARALDALVARLLKSGQADIAAEITDCRRESSRSGGLRITRPRQSAG